MFSPYFNPSKPRKDLMFPPGTIQGGARTFRDPETGMLMEVSPEDGLPAYEMFAQGPPQKQYNPYTPQPGDKYDAMTLEEDLTVSERAAGPYMTPQGYKVDDIEDPTSYTPPTSTQAGEMGFFPPGAPMALVSKYPLQVPIYNPQNIPPAPTPQGPQLFQQQPLVEPSDMQQFNPQTGLPEIKVAATTVPSPFDQHMDERGVRPPSADEVRPNMAVTGGVTMPEGTGNTMINFQNPYVAPQLYDMNNLMPELLRGTANPQPPGGPQTTPTGDQEITGLAPSQNNLAWNQGQAPTVPNNELDVKFNVGKSMPFGSKNAPIDPVTGEPRSTTKIEAKGPGQITQAELEDPTFEVPEFQQNTFNNLPPDVKAEVNEQAKANGMTPEKYYMFKGMLDAGALFNNIIQQPPPTMQLEKPHYERTRLNREIFNKQRSDVNRMFAQSYRGGRENISDISEFIKLAQATSASGAEAMRQVGSAEQQQALATEQYNQNVSMNEQNVQTQTNNEEQKLNFQVAQQAQMHKDQMISAQLGRIGDTVGAYAKYVAGKEQAKRAEEINAKEVSDTNTIQTEWLKYEAAKAELASPQYASAERAALIANSKDITAKLLTDPKYTALQQQYGDATPSYLEYQNRMNTEGKYLMSASKSVKDFEKAYPNGAPVKTDYTDDASYKNALSQYEEQKEYYEIAKADPKIMNFETEQAFWKDVYTQWDKEGFKSKFAETYLGERKLPTTSQFVQNLESIMNRTRQDSI